MISTQPSPLWAALELTLGVVIIAAGLLGDIPLSSTPRATRVLARDVVDRGWLMNRLAELWRFSAGGWIAAVVLSSALFGLVHLYQGASGMIATGLNVGFLMIYFGTYPGL